MRQSPYASDIQRILASLSKPKDEQGDQPLPDEEEALQEIHVYPVEGGGLLFTQAPLEDEPQATILDSEPPVTPLAVQPTGQREQPHLLSFVLILCAFLLLDVTNSQLIALTTPSASITITPDARTLTLRSTAQLGKLLAPITVAESQTVPTTGHGHQDARQAQGTLTFYDGLATVQQVAAGTILIGQDGIRVATDAAVTIPPANPPGLGESSVSTHAVQAGASGNIRAGDMNITLSTGVYVKNLAAFSGGQDERDYMVVTRADRDTAAATLHAKVTASMTAALHGRLLPGQALQAMPCPPTVTADHGIGEEAPQLTVAVSETCSAIAYDNQQLTAKATQLLTTQATRALGTGYLLAGNVQVSVTHATTRQTTSGVVLTFTCRGTYVYLLGAQAQQGIKALIAGQSRLTALHVLVEQRGIHTASISGISDNQLLPDDLTHLHLLIIYVTF